MFQLRGWGVHADTLGVNSTTAENFAFDVARYYSEDVATTGVMLTVADGASLVIDDAGYVAKQQFYRCVRKQSH